MKRPLALTLKLLFVAGCSAAAAWSVQTVFALNDHVGAVGAALLIGWLVFASWLQHHRRDSASWLTLAYGSWMTIHVMLFVATCSTRATPWNAISTWVTLGVVAVFGYGGLRKSLNGDWGGVVLWWLLSFILYFFYLFCGTLVMS